MEPYTDTLLPALAEGAKAADRDESDIEKMIEMKVSYDHDQSRAIGDCGQWAALALSGEQKMGVEDPREMERLAAQVPDPERRWLVACDPESHLEQIKPYIELGFTHLVFHAPGPDQLSFIELYGREILPALRKLSV
jgi:coenzyme F420-dependent glucose-6-phosphate dehydrogenase